MLAHLTTFEFPTLTTTFLAGMSCGAMLAWGFFAMRKHS